jgi:hypothetical protein
VRAAAVCARRDSDAGTGSRVDIALAALIVLLGGALLVYLSHAIVSRI